MTGLASVGVVAGCAPSDGRAEQAACAVVVEGHCVIATDRDRLAPLRQTADAAQLLAALPPGEERETTTAFRRDFPRWPYLDVHPLSRAEGSNEPDTPHAAYFLGASEDGAFGPVVMIAPAKLGHDLAEDRTDRWRVLEGPYAPTVYGDARTPSGTVHFIAYPASPGPVRYDETARRALHGALESFFRSGGSPGKQ